MSTHNAEYFRHRRRVWGISARDLFSAPKFLRRAAELQCLEQLPWSRNLFGQPATIGELVAEAARLSRQRGKDHDDVCPCGCGGITNAM